MYNPEDIWCGGQCLLEGLKSFYKDESASLPVMREMGDKFGICVGVRLGFLVSQRLLIHNLMVGCVRELKVYSRRFGWMAETERNGAVFHGRLLQPMAL